MPRAWWIALSAALAPVIVLGGWTIGQGLDSRQASAQSCVGFAGCGLVGEQPTVAPLPPPGVLIPFVRPRVALTGASPRPPALTVTPSAVPTAVPPTLTATPAPPTSAAPTSTSTPPPTTLDLPTLTAPARTTAPSRPPG